LARKRVVLERAVFLNDNIPGVINEQAIIARDFAINVSFVVEKD
jgi:hypothetical protein